MTSPLCPQKGNHKNDLQICLVLPLSSVPFGMRRALQYNPFLCAFWNCVYRALGSRFGGAWWRSSLTFIPALRHLPTASGTAARGGSIIEINPTKQSLSTGKLTSSVSNWKPSGNWSSGRAKWQNPVTNPNQIQMTSHTRMLSLVILNF